jgi:multidrug transporter EmrE-like cation transporter
VSETVASWVHWLALALGVTFNIAANVFFKEAMRSGSPNLGLQAYVLGLLGCGWLWLGVLSSVALLGSYLYALRAVPLVIAYPTVTGLAMVGIALVSSTFLGTTLVMWHYLGILLVVGGVTLLSL